MHIRKRLNLQKIQQSRLERLEENMRLQNKDVVIGIAASGTTPYVIATLEKCNQERIITGCISCNKNSPLAAVSKFPIEVVVGPEFVTGSSRMKAGTAQKIDFKHDFYYDDGAVRER